MDGDPPPAQPAAGVPAHRPPPPLSPCPVLSSAALPCPRTLWKLLLPHPVTPCFPLTEPLSSSRTSRSTLQRVQRGPSGIWGHTSFQGFPEPAAQSAFKGGRARLSLREVGSSWLPSPTVPARPQRRTTGLRPSTSSSSTRSRRPR